MNYSLATLIIFIPFAALYIYSLITMSPDWGNLSNTWTSALFTAAPTLPILALFSMLIPNFLLKSKLMDPMKGMFITLLVTLVVILSASFTLSLAQNTSNSTIVFYILSSALAAVIYFLFIPAKFGLKIILSIIGGLLVTPYIGIKVVLLYGLARHFLTIGLDLILVSILGVFFYLFIKKQQTFIPNLIFVVVILLVCGATKA